MSDCGCIVIPENSINLSTSAMESHQVLVCTLFRLQQCCGRGVDILCHHCKCCALHTSSLADPANSTGTARQGRKKAVAGESWETYASQTFFCIHHRDHIHGPIILMKYTKNTVIGKGGLFNRDDMLSGKGARGNSRQRNLKKSCLQ